MTGGEATRLKGPDHAADPLFIGWLVQRAGHHMGVFTQRADAERYASSRRGKGITVVAYYQPDAGRHWTIRQTGGRPMSLNQERTMNFYTVGKVTKTWREAAYWLAKEAKIPRLNRARFVAIPLHATAASPQDAGNCLPAVKAMIDGLVQAQILEDDGPAFVTSIELRAPIVCGEDGLELVVEELL